jgi:hypothetical protein
VSYRHRSYRKMSVAVKKANAAHVDGGPGEHPGMAFGLTRSEMDRVLHWSGQPALPKPPGWGKPKSRRAS